MGALTSHGLRHRVFLRGETNSLEPASGIHQLRTTRENNRPAERFNAKFVHASIPHVFVQLPCWNNPYRSKSELVTGQINVD